MAAAASAKPSVLAESPVYADMGYLPSAYVVKGSSSRKRRDKPGAQRYRHEQLIEMVQRSLAENLSFQTERYTIIINGYELLQRFPVTQHYSPVFFFKIEIHFSDFLQD